MNKKNIAVLLALAALVSGCMWTKSQVGPAGTNVTGVELKVDTNTIGAIHGLVPVKK